MANYERFFDPRILARIGRLELRARMIVEGTISGMHKSPYHGHSVEFVDHRPYVPGDDPRYIDWKVLGRADRVVLKRYEEETNLRGQIILDCSESMRYGDPPAAPGSKAGLLGFLRKSEPSLTKYEYAGTLAASIAYLLQRQHDAVGLVLFDSEVRSQIAPSTNPGTLLRIGEVLDQTPPARKTGLARTFREIAESIPRRGMVIVISDLFAPVDEIAEGLRTFVVRKHDLIVFHILASTELSFPFEGNTLFRGLEEYPNVLADPRALREGYRRALRSYLDRVERVASDLRAAYFRTDTSQPLDAAIVAVISARSRARGRHRRS